MLVSEAAVQAAWEAFDGKGGYSMPEKLRAALTAAAPFMTGARPGSFVNDAGITAADMPHIVVQKLDAAYDARIMSAIVSAPHPRRAALEEAARLAERMYVKDAFRFEFGRDIAAAIRALSSLPVADGWLPIETAPKDGTDFIGWDGKRPFRCSAGKYYVLYPHQEGGPTYRDVWNGDYYDSIMPENPTHWRPLPTPPEAQG